MSSRTIILIPVIALVAGIVLGIYAATSFHEPAAQAAPLHGLVLDDAAQKDYILNVADAYGDDANYKLAQDRLNRLQDPNIAQRVEALALEYASKRTLTSVNLARLAVATGSQITSLVALFVTATPVGDGRRTVPPTAQPTSQVVFSNVRATAAPTQPPTATPAQTEPPVYVVVPNDNPYIVLPTDTPTITPTPLPRTRVPTPTQTLVPTDIPPPPGTIWEPDRSRWPGTVSFEPANVAPGQGYWHLAHAVYCDAFDSSDQRKFEFGCEEGPGGGAGTSIYVMSQGSEIDVWSGGENVSGDPTIVGDKKNPGDMCLCDYSFESSNVKVNVRGAPSDAIGGFCLCGVNFGWGSRAHVRFFLYFEYITR